MRRQGLIAFNEEVTADGTKPVGPIKDTGLASMIRDAFGGMSLDEMAMISRHAEGPRHCADFRPAKQLPSEQDLDVFVLMPFTGKLEAVYKRHMKKMAQELGLRDTRRADELFSARPFTHRTIWDTYAAAEVIFADCTEKNANVFYEVGVAHAVGKRVVLITRSDKDVPSDIKHFDYIHYDYNPKGVDELMHQTAGHFWTPISSWATQRSIYRQNRRQSQGTSTE